MPRLAVRPFASRDLDAAAALLAARHRAARAVQPMLPLRFETPEASAGRLRAVLDDRWMSGAVAERDGRMAGFLLGTKEMHAPDSMPAKFSEAHSAVVTLSGQAVAEGEDPCEVLTALYAHLAEPWTDHGFFRHEAHIFASEPGVEEAWQNLGFGRVSAYVGRSTEPPAAALPAGVEVIEATSEDIEVVTRLTHFNIRHHRTPPIFWPYLRETDAALRTFEEGALAESSNGIFIASSDGEPRAMHLYLASGFGQEQARPDGSVYLFEAVVAPDARDGGLGTGLLAHTLGWAQREGYELCTLHFATANPSGRQFWLSRGFTPLAYNLARHVDERIAWGRFDDDEET